VATRKLEVEIVGDASKLQKAFKSSSRDAAKFNQQIGKIGVGVGTLVKATAIVEAAAFAFRKLGDAVGAGIQEFSDHEKVAAQTGAVLKSTGNAAGITAQQVDKLASSISAYSGADDEAIQAGENMLLTFTNIRNVVGKNNDIFNQATKATADLAQAMGIDATKAALQIGKALNDPARGYARLQRIGVAFTKTQVAQIKSFTKAGRVMDAQRVILAELNKEFGGSAKAFGDSLPGQLKKLQESFRNLAGELVGSLAPAVGGLADRLAGGLRGLNDFVERIGAATTTRAKLTIIWEGIENAGRTLFNLLRRQVTNAIDGLRNINWAGLADWARGLATRIGDAIQAVDWVGVISRAARRLGDALVTALNGLRSLINRVDWQKLGKRLVDGIGLAVGALIVFLRSVNWRAVIEAIARFLVAAVRVNQLILLGIGKEIGRILWKGLGDALAALGRLAQIAATKVILALLEPFTHLPRKLGGGVFQDLKKTMQAQLQDLQATAQAGGETITKALAQGMADGSRKTPPALIPPSAGGTAKPPSDVGGGSTTKKKTGETLAEMRNAWFDAAIGRQLGRVQDITAVTGQIAVLQQIAAQIQKRMAATKDVTRWLNLEDKLLDVFRQIKAARQQHAQDLIAALQLGLAKAEVTAGVEDDIATIRRINDALRRQIAESGATPELLQQLFDNEQAIKSKQEQRRQTKIDWLQFGLEKAEATKGINDDISWQRKIIAAMQDRIKAEGRKLELVSELWRQQQKLKGLLKQRPKVDPEQFVQFGGGPKMRIDWWNDPEGLRLAKQAGVSGINVPGRTPGLSKPAVGGSVITIGNLNLHGIQDVPALEDELVKRSKQRPQPRRGR
jgi:hypothetical protein